MKELQAEERENKKVAKLLPHQAKKWAGYFQVLPFIGWQGLSDRYLSSTNQVIPDWFKITFLGRLKL